MRSGFSRCLVWFVVAMGILIPTQTSFAAAEPKTVLILHSYGQNFKPWSEYAKALRQELQQRSPWKLIIQDFSVITARAEELNPEYQFVDYLRALFVHSSPDLIVAFGAPGGAFAQTHRKELFPGVPLILAAIEERRVQSVALTENDTVVAVRQSIPVLFGNILQLLPRTKTVAVVIGDSPNERYWTLQMDRELEPLNSRVRFIFYNELSFDEILRQAASLPPNSAIFWVQPQVDAQGVVHDGDRALKDLSKVANAPIFSFDDAFFSGEIVGGPMTSVSAVTRITTDVALRILGGEKPATITTPVLQYGPAKYDWRQLQRWAISESRLPPGSEIQFREATVWQKYRREIVLLASILLIQAVLIGWLFFEHQRRRQAELQAKKQMSEIAHVTRFSTAGELTASIAHELNQPLAAILTNAETLELLVKSPSPDMNEIAEIASDIRRDNQRASGVIARLRSLLKKRPYQTSNLDLNEVVGEAVQLLSGLVVARQVELRSFLCSTPLAVEGDRVQLQQVVLNLVINAMDAMSAVPPAKRRVTVETARQVEFAEVSVGDTGPGIQAEDLKKVFEPFYSTKEQGMGMGLSIARTIIDAHNGRISVHNRAGTGALFRVTLPLGRAKPRVRLAQPAAVEQG